MSKFVTICAVVGLIVAVSGTAQANWSDDFNDMTSAERLFGQSHALSAARRV